MEHKVTTDVVISKVDGKTEQNMNIGQNQSQNHLSIMKNVKAIDAEP